MTDNIITRDEAIDRMKAGLPCESNLAGGPWVKTEWQDFGNSLLKFRKPPEPRRVAREFWIFPEGGVYDHHVAGAIHVREVLPGDVACERMKREEALALASAGWNPYLVISESGWRDARMGLLRALGLIGEGS